MSVRYGRQFFKMTGSGNDFVFFDALTEAPGPLATPDEVRELCARGTGVGADGVVFLEPSERADFSISYYNADGSRAALCGNASLCTVRLAVELGIGRPTGLTFVTDSGIIDGRLRDELPEIDLQPVTCVRPVVDVELLAGEQRVGYAEAGVPHVVVVCDDVERADLNGRGRSLRWNSSFPQGANANFVSGGPDAWRMRTFERGVEGETLACGTGAVATALLLNSWGLAGTGVELETRSGQILGVRMRREPNGAAWQPSLRGEGRIVYRAALALESRLGPASHDGPEWTVAR